MIPSSRIEALLCISTKLLESSRKQLQIIGVVGSFIRWNFHRFLSRSVLPCLIHKAPRINSSSFWIPVIQVFSSFTLLFSIVMSVNLLQFKSKHWCCGSIILTGGSTLFPQLKERLERELRPLVPDHFDVKITTQED